MQNEAEMMITGAIYWIKYRVSKWCFHRTTRTQPMHPIIAERYPTPITWLSSSQDWHQMRFSSRTASPAIHKTQGMVYYCTSTSVGCLQPRGHREPISPWAADSSRSWVSALVGQVSSDRQKWASAQIHCGQFSGSVRIVRGCSFLAYEYDSYVWYFHW